MKMQFISFITDVGFFSSAESDANLNYNADNWPLVKGVLVAGLCPSVARVNFGRNRVIVLREIIITFARVNVHLIRQQPPETASSVVTAAIALLAVQTDVCGEAISEKKEPSNRGRMTAAV